MHQISPQNSALRKSTAIYSICLIGFFPALLLLLSVVFGAFASQGPEKQAPTKQAPAKQSSKEFQLTSTAFESDGAIPAKYACTGANVSPALTWTAPPDGTQSFALVVDDPDAPSGPVSHWLLYAIPAATRSLAENTPTKATLPNGSKQGKNSAGKVGYRGPCPDPGKVHHYFFKIFALDYVPNLKPKANAADVEAALKDHVLAKSELIGRFEHNLSSSERKWPSLTGGWPDL
jgi:Raf kinase inhibitor-like YbhB/YbcL family protein